MTLHKYRPRRSLRGAKPFLTALIAAVGLAGHMLTSAGPALASGSDTLGPGQSLCPGQSLYSANGEFTLTMQSDGNLVLYRFSGNGTPWTALWSTGKDEYVENTPGAWVVMQPDGNFVLYTGPCNHYPPTTQALWSSATSGHTGANSYLRLQSDANFPIYAGSGSVLWNPATYLRNTTLYPGDLLKPGWRLRSGQYTAIMQGDGNFVVYNASNQPFWSSNTPNHTGAWAYMQADGNFVVYSAGYLPAASPLWSSSTPGHSGAHLVIQTDGHLVVRSASGTMLDANPAYYTHYKNCEDFPAAGSGNACLDVGYWYNGLAAGINWATPDCNATNLLGWSCQAEPGPAWYWDDTAYNPNTGETGGYTADVCQAVQWLPSEHELMYAASLWITVWRSGNVQFYATTSMGDCHW